MSSMSSMNSLQRQHRLGGSTSSLASMDGNKRYTAPPLAVGGRRESLVDTIERQRKMSNTQPRLKGLVVPGGGKSLSVDGLGDQGQRSRRSSVSGVMDLPKIGQTKVDANSLPVTANKRRMSYQPMSQSLNFSKMKGNSLDRRSSSMTPLKAMAQFGDEREGKERFMNGEGNKENGYASSSKPVQNGVQSAALKPPTSKPPPPPTSSSPRIQKENNYVYTKETVTNGATSGPSKQEAEKSFESPPPVPKSSPRYTPQTPPPTEDAIVYGERPKLNFQPKMKKSTSSYSSQTSTTSLSPIPASPVKKSQSDGEVFTHLTMGFDASSSSQSMNPSMKPPPQEEVVLHSPVRVQRKVYNPDSHQSVSEVETQKPTKPEAKRATSVVEMSVSPQPLKVNTSRNGTSSLMINLSTPESRFHRSNQNSSVSSSSSNQYTTEPNRATAEPLRAKSHYQAARDMFNNNSNGTSVAPKPTQSSYSTHQMQRLETAVDNMSSELTSNTPLVVSRSVNVPKERWYSEDVYAKEEVRVEEVLQEEITEDEESNQAPPPLPTEAPPPVPRSQNSPTPPQTSSTFTSPAPATILPSHKKQDSFEDLLEMDLEKSPRGGGTYSALSTSRDSSNFDSSEELDLPSSRNRGGGGRKFGVVGYVTAPSNPAPGLRSSREDLSHAALAAPPISPTPSDTDSGIYSTKAEHETPEEKAPKLSPVIYEEYSKPAERPTQTTVRPNQPTVSPIQPNVSTVKSASILETKAQAESRAKDNVMVSSSSSSSSLSTLTDSPSVNTTSSVSSRNKDSELNSVSKKEEVAAPRSRSDEVVAARSRSEEVAAPRSRIKEDTTDSIPSTAGRRTRERVSPSVDDTAKTTTTTTKDKSGDPMERWRKYRSTDTDAAPSRVRAPAPAEPAMDLTGYSEETTVELNKGAIGLGFCIEGGKGSPLGDRPITVKRLFKGSSAALGLLQPGDIIVSGNGMDFSDLSHFTVWNHLKGLPEGTITLKIKRKV